ncbi:MAG: hypothetical protein KF681_07825 [Bdellovibrionaceae bacterium]|nr:hypothetical protein [Pseudobdellovibrionaceae bacterium]
MAMIDRYKKKGGFVQLLNLIETTAPAKAEKFLQMIAEESPVWEAEIRKKCISLDRMSTWNQTYLMEVFPRLTPNVIGTALSSLPEEKKQIFLGALAFSERRKVEDFLKEAKPQPGEVASCQMKIINEVRAMVSQGALKLDKVDAELAIPENIEDQLNSGMSPSASAKDIDVAFDSVAASAGVPASGGGSSSEELMLLRKKIVSLTQENQLLKQQLQTMKDKLDTIRKAAA